MAPVVVLVVVAVPGSVAFVVGLVFVELVAAAAAAAVVVEVGTLLVMLGLAAVCHDTTKVPAAAEIAVCREKVEDW
jgi:hypothetical protein